VPGEELGDFPVPWYRLGDACFRITVPIVISAVADEYTPGFSSLPPASAQIDLVYFRSGVADFKDFERARHLRDVLSHQALCRFGAG
jgi:hypothetical protein